MVRFIASMVVLGISLGAWAAPPGASLLHHPLTHYDLPSAGSLPGESAREKALNLILTSGFESSWALNHFDYFGEIVLKVQNTTQLNQLIELVYAGVGARLAFSRVASSTSTELDLVELLANAPETQRFARVLQERRFLLRASGPAIGRRLQARLRAMAAGTDFQSSVKIPVPTALIELAGQAQSIAAYDAIIALADFFYYWNPSGSERLLEGLWIFKFALSLEDRGQARLVETAARALVAKRGIFEKIREAAALPFTSVQELLNLLAWAKESRTDSNGDVVHEFNSLTIADFAAALDRLKNHPPAVPAPVRYDVDFVAKLRSEYALYGQFGRDNARVFLHVAKNASSPLAREAFEILADLDQQEIESLLSVEASEVTQAQVELLRQARELGVLGPYTANAIQDATRAGEASLSAAMAKYYKYNDYTAKELAKKAERFELIRRSPNDIAGVLNEWIAEFGADLDEYRIDKWKRLRLEQYSKGVRSTAGYLGFLAMIEELHDSLEYNGPKAFDFWAQPEWLVLAGQLQSYQQVRLLKVMMDAKIRTKGIVRQLSAWGSENEYFFRKVREFISRGVVEVRDSHGDVVNVYNSTTIEQLKQFVDDLRRTGPCGMRLKSR